MHEIHLSLNRSEGALLRVLGMIERRGFRVVDLGCHEHAEAVSVKLKLDGQRRVAEVLVRQIARLHDVRSTELLAPRPAPPAPRDRWLPPVIPASAISRRSLSFLGIPESISSGPAQP